MPHVIDIFTYVHSNDIFIYVCTEITELSKHDLGELKCRKRQEKKNENISAFLKRIRSVNKQEENT